MKMLRICYGFLFPVVTLCFAVLPILAASAPQPQPALDKEWVTVAGSLQVSVNTETGVIDHLIDTVTREDYCNQHLSDATADTDGNSGVGFTVGARIGGLLLLDELRQRTFSDLGTPGTMTNVHTTAAGDERRLEFDKQYPGADFLVHETLVSSSNGLRWDVRLHKLSGPDRTVRVIFNLPLPLGGQAWAPIATAPFPVKPWLPFSIDYGQSTSGAIGEGDWRTTVPLMVFYSPGTDRALAVASPLDLPAVRVRFLTNTGALADFYWNSRSYPAAERPYFEVSNEDLGMRSTRDLEAGVLLSAQPANWRPSLGWFYGMYRKYFDPSPAFAPWDGAYAGGDALMNPALNTAQVKAAYAREYANGVRWEEYHSPYVRYGQMIPDPQVQSWADVSDPGGPTLTRARIEQHCKLSREAGVGTFLYFNTTESEHGWAEQKFPASIAKTESGKTIAAWRGNEYPNPRACWLMNSDPSTGFGRSMAAQARQMVDSYPDAAGFFWDVFDRSYMFDFAHDDGITMVDNRPAYYPEFMYQRLMSQSIAPLLHRHGMTITANKPVTVAGTENVDGIMMMENAPYQVSPGWITAQSYLGLTRHVMILDGNPADQEMLYLHCLRYGAFNSMVAETEWRGKPVSPELVAANRKLHALYQPWVNRFAGKQWIFYPHALTLPDGVEGNLFRLKNGDVMVTMVSAWRALHHAEGDDRNLPVVIRLPDAASFRRVRVAAIDLEQTTAVTAQRRGDQLTVVVPRHGKATVILFEKH